MPELPEVETVCRGLNQLTFGQTIEGAEVLLDRTLAYPPSSQEFLDQIQNATFDKWQRRGPRRKYMYAKEYNSSLPFQFQVHR